MTVRTPLDPWSWKSPMVDPETGRPTPEFGRWLQTTRLNEDWGVGQIATKADKKTRIIAGNGLSGGGDLSADRTLSLDAVLDDLNDVDTTTTPPTNGQGLAWDDAAPLWVPKTFASGGSGSTPAIRGSNIQSSSNSSYTVTWPLGTVDGDVVLIFVGHGFAVDVIPAGWAQFGKLSGANFNGSVLAKTMTSADIAAGSVAVSLAGAYNGVLVCVALDGATVTTMTTNGYFARDGVGVTALSAPVIAASATNLVLMFFANRAASDDTAGTGTLVQAINATEASGAIYAVDPASSGFAAALSFSVAGTGYYVGQIAISGP
jgi:hypothetical protein